MATTDRKCRKCGGAIPPHKRRDAKFCSSACQKTAQARRRRLDHSIRKQETRKKLEVYHLRTHGHLDFLNNPKLNPKDRFWKARSMGYRSMLEVEVAKDLEEAGVQFSYESMTIPYDKGGISHG